MSTHHYAFGLHISSNFEIPGFAAGSERTPADVQVIFGRLPEGIGSCPPADQTAMYISPWNAPNEGPSTRIWRTPDQKYFRILYGDGTHCAMDREGRQIWIHLPERYALEDAVPYLQGQLLGLAQRLRGVTCLHASAVVIGDGAVAITGPAGSGKSATAAAFLQSGFPILADDVVPIFENEGKFWVRPAHQRLWLCPDMVESLYGSADALPRFAPSWDKRYVDLSAAQNGWPKEPRPLAAIYVLSGRAKKSQRSAILNAAPRDILLELLANTYLNHLFDEEMRSREFALLSRLQQAVPARLVRPRGDGSKIQELCQAIVADLHSQRA